jgi:uncharacterized protein (TIGR00255 family)
MTGYGKAEAQISGGKITVEIRSLNGKNADINIKSALLPKDKDLEVRKLMAEKLVRGTIDLYLSFEPANGSDVSPINTDSLMKHFRQIQEASPILIQEPTAAATIMGSLLRLPDVVETRKADVIGPEDWPQVAAALAEALDGLCAYRRQEGAALYADVTSRVKLILSLYDQVEALEGERIALVKEKLTRSLAELQAKPNPERFEQELIFYLEKYDINEEKVRLRQHCKYFMEVIDAEPYPGKKLGFIIQEMGREINTTGSKANHAQIQQLVVRMKDELEKIREQSMNIL